jgi:hypothetical protein
LAHKSQKNRDYKSKYLRSKIAKLKLTPARDKRILDAKIDVVACLMAPPSDAKGSSVRGFSFEQARKEDERAFQKED